MPPELARHLKGCSGCSALLSRLRAQSVVRLPESLVAGIPDMKKHVLSQIGRQNARLEKETEAFAWSALWKLALIPFVLLLVIAYFMAGQTTHGTGQESLSGNVVATLVRAESLVEKLCAGTTDYVKALPADQLLGGDAIRTGDDASAELAFADGSKVLLGPGAWFKVNDEKQIGEHLRGRAVFEIEKQTGSGSVEILTPQGVTAVLGTKFVQEIGENAGFIAVTEGIVEFRSNRQERQLLRPGHLLCFDSSGKITDRKEPGSAVILKLYDLKQCVALEAVVSSENIDSGALPLVGPDVEPASITDTVGTSAEKIDRPGVENSLSSDSVQTVPAVDPAGIASDDVSVPDNNASEASEDALPVEPDQAGGSGQSTLGVTGL
ncbi:MAG: hypothetical protein A2W80_00655 [Candidatus Riflebacteria bacterium GWC2_50_8]|nr:MAG: hypothetical protein A2W80_00655 [Candidatus Riflebacteria bacterium GWC2_50_8]